ncbi:MAG: helix-turn-helix domain-containing protein [Acidobacteriota bacterium]
MAEKNYLTVEEAAAQLRVAVDTMRRYLRERRLPCARIGKRYLVPAGAIESYIQQHVVNGGKPTKRPGRKAKAPRRKG